MNGDHFPLRSAENSCRHLNVCLLARTDRFPLKGSQRNPSCKIKRPPCAERTMLPNALPQLDLPHLMDALLRLPHQDAAQLRELIQNLPDPQGSAEEMVLRGWITPSQFSSLFPDPTQRPKARKTMLIGFADDDSPPDADCDWSVPISDEEETADVPPQVETERGVRKHFLGPVLFGTASAPPVESNMPAPRVVKRNEDRRWEEGMDKLPRQWMSWASKGLLCSMLLWGFFVGLQFFRAANAIVPPVDQEPRQAKAGEPAKAVDMPPRPQVFPIMDVKQGDHLPNSKGQDVQPAAPAAVPPAAPVAVVAPATPLAPAPADARPKSTASLYDRVRQVVLENKTVETQRLGIGDIAYREVPEDGSIMVGMEVTYVPFFTHNVIKSVRPIYQRADGTRYDGAICGNPTQDRERVVAKEGYAIGGAAIQSGMGIDAMQLTFMEIGADGLNPNKSYLSKWLGGYGGSDAKMFLNDGRPIVGVAGMVSKLNFGPAFCMGLVTTREGALAAADGLRYQLSPSTTPNSSGQSAQRITPAAEGSGSVRTEPGPE